MSNPRLPTLKLRQIIQFESRDLSAREVGRALCLSHGAISKYRCAVRAAGVTWEEAQRLDDAELESKIWKARTEHKPREVVLPDCATIHTELKRHKHVTLQLLWDEYHATHGTLALRYSSYCERYRHWVRRLQRSMRQRHYAGEKLFVDYAGATVPIYGATCEEAYRAAIFVGALGASGYAYAEATRTASLPDWLGSTTTDTGATMLTQNTLETPRHLKLHGMAQALEEQRDTPNTHALSFEERLALLVDRERLSRQNTRYRGLLRDARLKVAQACVEDVNYKSGRGLDKAQIAALADRIGGGRRRLHGTVHDGLESLTTIDGILNLAQLVIISTTLEHLAFALNVRHFSLPQAVDDSSESHIGG